MKFWLQSSYCDLFSYFLGMWYFSSSPDYQAYLLSLLLREIKTQDARSPFRFVPKGWFIGRWKVMDNYFWVLHTLQLFQKEGILSDLIVNVCTTYEKDDHIEPVRLGSVRIERQKDTTPRLAIPALFEWEEQLGEVLIHKDMEFVEVLGSIDQGRARDFLKTLSENWYNGKFRDGYPPEKMREVISETCKELWYGSSTPDNQIDLTKFDTGLHLFLGFLFLESQEAIRIQYPRIPPVLDNQSPKTISIKILREFWNEKDFVSVNREHIRHSFEFDIDRDQLKYNGVYMSFWKKNLDFIRTFFDLLEDGQEYIQVDEILLWVERGFADIWWKDRYNAKKTHIYNPRKAVNKAIEKYTGLTEFFLLETENVRLHYPEYVTLSKKS